MTGKQRILLAKNLKEASIFHELALEFKNAPLYIRFEMVSIEIDDDEERKQYQPALVFESCWKNRAEKAEGEEDDESDRIEHSSR